MTTFVETSLTKRHHSRTIAAADLRVAADLIRERGLAKGTFAHDSGALCAVGALETARLGIEALAGWAFAFPDWTNIAYGMVREVLGVKADHPWIHISQWNDLPETTAQDVITLFEQAAEKLEADL